MARTVSAICWRFSGFSVMIETFRRENSAYGLIEIEAAVANARAFLRVQKEFRSFSDYVWRFVGGKPLRNAWRHVAQIPAASPRSEAMSRDLKKRGFTFVGPTICYAFMQAVGMVNDHTVDCFRYEEIGG